MVLRHFLAFYKKHALCTGAVLTGFKNGAADVLVQTQWEKKEEINWRRTAVFAGFGFCYLGMFQHWQYTCLHMRWFPGECWRAAAKKVVFDSTVNAALCYYPLFYMVQSCVMADEYSAGRVEEGWERYKMNFPQDYTAYLAIWLPVQTINFTLVPPHWRVLFGAAVSAAWSCLLSKFRGDPAEIEAKEKKSAPEAVPAREEDSEASVIPNGLALCASK
eukprot:TRINITY_DN24096_c0_g1_i1.p1 TRINITY_DN24096_c0_g1~~TRINITY_DN24096_c0_g1_i1.p1  ORF type:complete len:218 (-),score=51.07 TRINITY_DN24096_c0_g1_i1:157-810(-)